MINNRLFSLTKNVIHPYITYVRCNNTLENTSQADKGINKQIKAEHEASLAYLKLAVNFLHPRVSRPGVGGYFMRLYNEELKHMHCLIQYQLMRGCHPIIGDIQAPKVETISTMCQAFEFALQLENDVTALLKDLVKISESEGDYHCADFITATFLLEQMQSKNELLHHLTNLKRINDNEHALYNYDKELFIKFPCVFNQTKN